MEFEKPIPAQASVGVRALEMEISLCIAEDETKFVVNTGKHTLQSRTGPARKRGQLQIKIEMRTYEN